MKKFKTSFAYDFKKLDKSLAKASLESLRPFIPNIDTEKDFDLLPFACDACQVNVINKNFHGITSVSAVNLYKSFIFRPTNIEHSRKTSMGVILSSSLTDLNNNQLTEEQALATDEPFYITLGGVLWRIVNNNACEVIEASNDKDSEIYMELSSSWELNYSDHDIILLPKGETLIKNGEIISDAAEKEKYAILLEKSNKLPDGRQIGKVLKDCSALGLGFTFAPAANVSGVAVTQEAEGESAANSNQEQEMSEIIQKAVLEALKQHSSAKNMKKMPKKTPMICPECDAEMDIDMEKEETECSKCGKTSKSDMWKTMENQANLANLENNQKNIEKSEINISHLKISNVNQDDKIMKITSLKDITDENLKQVTASTVVEFIESEMKKASEKWAGEQKEKETSVAEAKKVQEELIKAKEKLETELAEVKKQVETFAKEKEAAKKQDLFNHWMGEFDTHFDLTADDRKVIANQIKDLDEAGITEYYKNSEVLLKEKHKISKKVLAEAAEKAAKEKQDKEAKASAEDKINTAVEGAKTNEPPPTTPAKTQTTKEKWAKAFGPDSYTISHK